MIHEFVHHRGIAALGALLLAFALVLPAGMPVWAAAPPSPPLAATHVQLSSTVIAPGGTVTVTGQGFTPGATVVISVDLRVQGTSRGVQAAARANASGAFTAPLTIPAGTSPGVYSVKSRDFYNHTATLNLTVRPEVVLQAGKQATLTIGDGQGFFARGAGFEPGEAVVFTGVFRLYNGNAVTITKSAAADKNGMTGAVYIVIPQRTQQGTGSLTATGQKSGRKGTAAIAVVYRPVISLNPATVRPGGTTTVSGAGFVAGTTIRIALTIPRTGSSTITVTKTVAANAAGAISTTFALPASAQPGAYTLTATDEVGGFHAQHAITVAVSPSIAVQPASAYPGGSVILTGAHYGVGVQVVVTAAFPLVGGGSKTVTHTVQTNGSGDFSLTLAVPAGTAAAPVTVVGRGPHAQATTRLTVVRLNATMTVTPNPITPGQTVTVSGAGFGVGIPIVVSAIVPLYGGGSKTLSTTVRSNGQGQYTARLAIPRDAASVPVTVTAKGVRTQRSVRLQIGRLSSTITISPTSAAPGGSVTISGSGYSAGARIDISVSVHTSSGATEILPLTVTANANGTFTATLRVPATVAAGVYTVSAKSVTSGRVRTAQLTIAKLTPTIVAVPASGAPGSSLTINGSGFAPGVTVALSILGQRVGAATTNAGGQFSVRAAIPQSLASGQYHITATTSAGRTTSMLLSVNRQLSTHFYFASLYTGSGYHEYLAFLNPTSIRARVQIAYQPTTGITRTKNISISPHSRFTEDVNADVGVHVSTAAAVSADVAISAERMVFHGSDGAVVPGATSPATAWYFANGNTSHGYREYVAVQNPNSEPVQVILHVLPTHHRPLTVARTMPPSSRTTFKVNSYVKDAVGVTVTANGPVVANRTIFNKRGMTSKIGARSPQHRWYVAAGPGNGSAHNWIAVVNTSGRWSYLTLHAYGPAGREAAAVHAWLKPFARKGYLMSRVAHQNNVAVMVTSSQPSVVEQTTYHGRLHHASTDTFGVATPARTWEFAAASTWAGQNDQLSLFNPGLQSIQITVQYMNTSGKVSQRTYVVAPLNHQTVNVSGVMPNAQLGIHATSSQPFVALNRQLANGGAGAMTSTGFHS